MLTKIVLALLIFLAYTESKTQNPQPLRITNDAVNSIASVSWSVETQGPVRGGIVMNNENVFAGSADGNLYCVAKTSGVVKWKFMSNGPVSSTPVLSAEDVYFTSRDNFLYAIEITSGKLKWKFQMKKGGLHHWGYDYFLSSPVLSDGKIFTGDDAGNVYALSAKNGKLLWTFPTKGKIRSTPAVYKDLICVTGFDGYFYLLNRQNGKLQWKYETDGVKLDSYGSGWDRQSIDSSPFIYNGLAVFGSRDGNLYCLDLDGRKLKWKFSYTPTWSIATPVVQDGKVFTGWSDNFMFNSVDIESGKEIWSFKCGDYVYSSPVVTANSVIAGCADGNLMSFAKNDGRLLWKFKTKNSVYGSPAIDHNVIYFGSDDGNIYALRSSEKEPIKHKALFSVSSYSKIESPLAAYLSAQSFTSLDTTNIASFLRDRIADGLPSMLLFDYFRIPKAALAKIEDGTLIKKYMEAGGIVIWTDLPPNFIKVEHGQFAGYDSLICRELTGVKYDSYVQNGTGDYYSKSTDIGKSLGFPSWWAGTSGGYFVDPKDVDSVLAVNDHGRAVCWIKNIGKGKFIHLRTWKTAVSSKDMDLISNLAAMRVD